MDRAELIVDLLQTRTGYVNWLNANDSIVTTYKLMPPGGTIAIKPVTNVGLLPVAAAIGGFPTMKGYASTVPSDTPQTTGAMSDFPRVSIEMRDYVSTLLLWTGIPANLPESIQAASADTPQLEACFVNQVLYESQWIVIGDMAFKDYTVPVSSS